LILVFGTAAFETIYPVLMDPSSANSDYDALLREAIRDKRQVLPKTFGGNGTAASLRRRMTNEAALRAGILVSVLAEEMFRVTQRMR
jgi:hypothetical protein